VVPKYPHYNILGAFLHCRYLVTITIHEVVFPPEYFLRMLSQTKNIVGVLAFPWVCRQ
jgi:hypothetical protein